MSGRSDLHQDAELRERFAVLRREEAGQALPFVVARAAAALGQRPAPPALRRRVQAAVAGSAVLAALAVLAVVASFWVGGPPLAPPGLPPRSPAFSPSVSLAAWRAPTDFLLHTPGEELLTGAPLIGRDPALDIDFSAGARHGRIHLPEEQETLR